MFPTFNARAVGLLAPGRRDDRPAARAGFAGVDLLVRDLIADRPRTKSVPGWTTSDSGEGHSPCPSTGAETRTPSAETLRRLPASPTRRPNSGSDAPPPGSSPKAPSPLRLDPRRDDRLHIDRLGRIADALGASSHPPRPRSHRARAVPAFGGPPIHHETRRTLGPILDPLGRVGPTPGSCSTRSTSTPPTNPSPRRRRRGRIDRLVHLAGPARRFTGRPVRDCRSQAGTARRARRHRQPKHPRGDRRRRLRRPGHGRAPRTRRQSRQPQADPARASRVRASLRSVWPTADNGA